MISKKAVEVKYIPFRYGFITGCHYVYKTGKGYCFRYDALTGDYKRISAKKYNIINQKSEVL